MKHIRKFLPLAISLLAVCALLLALRPAANVQAVALSQVQTTIEDFNTGTFFHTGMTRYADGEVTLLRSGLASQWITTTNSTGLIPRYSHASIIYNNRLYVFGGKTSLSSSRSIQYAAINTVTHNLSNWITSTVTLPAAIYTSTGYSGQAGVASLSAVQLNNRVYLLGGDDGEDQYRYRTVTFASFKITGELTALTTTTPLPQALSEGQAVVQNGFIYYIGGRNSSFNGTDKVYYAQPDPVTGIITAWYTATSLLPYPTYAHMAVATSDGRLYSMGGVSLTSGSGIEPYVNYAEPLSTTGDILAWNRTSDLPNNIFGGAGVTFGGQIYPTGGAVNGLTNASNAVYAAFIEEAGGIISGSWQSTNPITPARLQHSAVVNPADGWIYVVGGSDGLGPIQQHLVNAGATIGGLGSNYASSGRFTATPFDLGKNYPSTALLWETILPNDPSIDTVSLTLRYRYRPDGGVYSNWSSLYPSQHIGGAAVTTVPITTAARFIQYEAFFTSSANITTPILTYVQLDYVIPTPPKMLKLADPPNGSKIAPGDVITYMIYFTNTSGAFLNGVVISDPVPAGVTYIPGSITASVSSGVIVSHPEQAPDIIWFMPTLPDLAVGYVGYAVQVNNSVQVGDVIYNQAELNNELIRSDSPVVNHQYGSALQLAKSHVTSAPAEAGQEGKVQPGDIITYTLIYTNPPDGVDAPGAVLTDVLPANVTYLGSIGSPAPTYNSSPPSLRWDIGYLSQGVTGTVGLVIQLNNNFTQWPDGSSVDNMAELKVTGRSLVRSNFGTADSAPVRYRFVLWMDQSVNATKASPGSLLTYTTRLTNVTSMPFTATNLTVYSILWPGLPGMTRTYILNCANACPGWYFNGLDSANELVYTRSIPALGPNQSTVITFIGEISSTSPSDVLAVQNTTYANPDGLHGVWLDPTRAFVDSITTVGGADIAVTAIRTPQRTAPNRATRFWVNVTNQGFTKTLGPDGRGWFGVDLYVQPVGSDKPFGPFDRQYGYCDQHAYNYPCSIQATHYATVNFTTTLGAGGLAANASLSVPFTLTINTPGLYWLYAQADPCWSATDGCSYGPFGTYSHGRILEGNETNNIFGPVLINVGYTTVYLPLIRKNS